MTRRSLLLVVAATVASFAVVFGGVLVLAAAAPKGHVHVPRPRPFNTGYVSASTAAAEFVHDHCTIVWTGRAGNQDWHTRGNWAPLRLPEPDDTACIPAGGKVTIKHDVKVARFVNHGDLTLAGGNVDFGSATSG